jgi:hypothetical protein
MIGENKFYKQNSLRNQISQNKNIPLDLKQMNLHKIDLGNNWIDNNNNNYGRLNSSNLNKP